MRLFDLANACLVLSGDETRAVSSGLPVEGSVLISNYRLKIHRPPPARQQGDADPY